MSNRIKSDGPTKAIVEALREVGASVSYVKFPFEDGGPDLLIGFLGKNYLQEVKDPKGKLSDDQKEFHRNWRGMDIDVVTSEIESLIAIGLVV